MYTNLSRLTRWTPTTTNNLKLIFCDPLETSFRTSPLFYVRRWWESSGWTSTIFAYVGEIRFTTTEFQSPYGLQRSECIAHWAKKDRCAGSYHLVGLSRPSVSRQPRPKESGVRLDLGPRLKLITIPGSWRWGGWVLPRCDVRQTSVRLLINHSRSCPELCGGTITTSPAAVTIQEVLSS